MARKIPRLRPEGKGGAHRDTDGRFFEARAYQAYGEYKHRMGDQDEGLAYQECARGILSSA